MENIIIEVIIWIFPELNRSDLLYPKKKPLNIRDFEIESNLLDQISKKAI